MIKRGSNRLNEILTDPQGRKAIHGVAMTGEIANVQLKNGKKVYILPDEKIDQIVLKNGMQRLKRRTFFGFAF